MIPGLAGLLKYRPAMEPIASVYDGRTAETIRGSAEDIAAFIP
jgi:hypothetical protein